MELLTAVLSGSRTLEVRVFSDFDYLTVEEEQSLTARLCLLTDRYSEQWRQ